MDGYFTSASGVERPSGNTAQPYAKIKGSIGGPCTRSVDSPSIPSWRYVGMPMEYTEGRHMEMCLVTDSQLKHDGVLYELVWVYSPRSNEDD